MAKAKFKTKLSKRQKLKDILIFFVVYLCAFAFTLLHWHFALDMWQGNSISETILLGVALTFYSSSMLLFPVLLAAVALGVQKGKARRVYNAVIYSPVHNLEYYRDSLSELGPALVSILMDLDMCGKKDIAATLLRMQNKKAIILKSGGHIEVTAKNLKGLDTGEKGLMRLIKSGKINDKKSLQNWKQNRFSEAQRLGYIQKVSIEGKQKRLNKYGLFLAIGMCITFALWGTFFALDLFRLNTGIQLVWVTLYLLITDAFVCVPIYLLCRHASYYRRKDILWQRTPLGNEITEKIAGLKRFIDDFTLLSEADKLKLTLWDDYLVYAIVLEENEKIVKDIGKHYKFNLRRNGLTRYF